MQSLTREKIELLVEKKLRGALTQEEQVLLDQWLNREPAEEMDWYSGDPDEQAFRERLLNRIRKSAGIPGHPATTDNIPRIRRYRWAAAAAIALLIAGGLSYLLFSGGGGATQVEIAGDGGRIQDVAPGHQGAVLTLANGNRIVLDSTGNGEIAVQGNRRLVKKNGQLVYENQAGGAPSNGRSPAGADIYNTMTTPRGREFRLVLSDGTKVWLNAASSITYPTAFTGKERSVSVTGEAYFEVAEDSRRPFIVSVGEASITVLGTHFDVMAYPEEEEVRTTLLEGSVRINRGTQKVVIRPGQQASFPALSGHIKVEEVDAGQATAWIDGKLSLDNLGVEAIMREISRWYDVDVTFEGKIPDERYWGLINRNVNLSDMLKVMRATGINAGLSGHKIIVSFDH